jgi:parvulin-like peptidyl-prolyl isomerase
MANPIKGLQRLTEEDVNRAAALLRDGLSPEAARGRLVEQGMAPGLADAALRQVGLQNAYAEAVEMLAAGQSPEAVKARLVQNGVSPFAADETIQEAIAHLESLRPGPGPVRKVVGGIVVAIGIGLWIGNMTGAFRTFPFAGIVVILIGFAIMGS